MQKNQERKANLTPDLDDEDVHYASGRNFEQNPPLPRIEEFEERDKMIWRKDPEKHGPETPIGPDTADVLAEDERDYANQDDAIVQDIIEDIIDQVYHLEQILE